MILLRLHLFTLIFIISLSIYYCIVRHVLYIIIILYYDSVILLRRCESARPKTPPGTQVPEVSAVAKGGGEAVGEAERDGGAWQRDGERMMWQRGHSPLRPPRPGL